LVDRSGRLVDGNGQACEALGYSKLDLLKLSIWDVEPAGNRESLMVQWQNLRPGFPITVETSFLRKDQSTFPAEIRTSILSLRAEEFLLLLVRDITDRRRNEEELRKTNAFLDSIIENIPDMIFIKDAQDLRFVRFNKAGEELLGYRREELLGKNDYDFFPREEADFFTRKDQDVLASGGTRDIGEEPIHTRSHGFRILHTKKIPIQDGDGKPVYLLGISEDVTDRKHAEERLRELSTAMEHAVEGIARLDEKGFFVTVNPSFDALLGYAADELNGISWEQIVYEKDLEKARAGYQKMVQWGKAEIELRARRRDGSIFYEQAVLIKVHDPDSRFIGAYLFIKDISERKYRESLEMKSEMISVVAHELRTPLHAVREGISVILDGLTGELNAEQQDVLLTSKGSLDRLVRLVNSFLDFQRLEAGIVDFHLSMAALPEVVHEAGKQVESLARGKNLSVEIHIGEGVHEVFMDRDRIFQVLVNLMNNGIKFTENGGIVVAIDRQEAGVRVAVRDTGIGIKAGDLPRLFRKFGQLESGQIVAPGGTGLGLAISRKIIEQHRGRLEVESEFGRGSCFYFTLPYSGTG